MYISVSATKLKSNAVRGLYPPPRHQTINCDFSKEQSIKVFKGIAVVDEMNIP